MNPNRIAAVWCWYQGGSFSGYQRQGERPTVALAIACGLRSIGIAANPVAAGRTDRGVHARMQVLSMRIPRDYSLDSIASGLSQGPALGVVSARFAPGKFNAAWTATGKSYRYRLGLEIPPAWLPFAWRTPLDPGVTAEALSLFQGTHDFFNFHGPTSSRRLRTVLHLTLLACASGFYEVHCCGNGFGRHQVRMMIGASVAAGLGLTTLDAIRRGLAGREVQNNRRFCAPPEGLALWEVQYPEESDPFAADRAAAVVGLPKAPPFITIEGG